jgi:hypothetical protein
MRLLEAGPSYGRVCETDPGGEGPATNFSAAASEQPGLTGTWPLAGFCSEVITREITEAEVARDKSAILTSGTVAHRKLVRADECDE